MKKMIALISLIASATVYGYEELHTFTMNDESVFNAVVLSCDSQCDTVELLMDDGHTVSSGLSTFAEEDRAYLKQKELEELFMSPTHFVIIPSHTVDQKWVGDDRGEDGVFPVTGISEHQYFLTIYNLGGADLENITLSYRILYTQSCSESDGPSFSEQLPDLIIEKEETTLSRGTDGIISIARLGAREWKVYSAGSAVVVDDAPGSSSSLMVISVSMEAADGTALTREIELPVFNSVVSNPD